MRRFIWIWMLMAIACDAVAEGDIIKLPLPRAEGGMPLMQALKNRHSSREFAARPLPMQVLSDLLWAADGVNRPDAHRTAPSARNMREILVYVAAADGTYMFDPDGHALRRILGSDVRALTGTQDFVAQAPVNLVYVADLSRIEGSDEDKRLYSAADTGFIAQNVYLYCASAGLAAVVRGSVDRPALAAELKLSPHQRIILAQTVGYPK
ncbi:MAG TPA: SagB/ThcOx family dehydrogenase [Rhodocyclaceae bacterium]|nr:SagB/ThcOx family dehydrogenase [Rhodocyclaceae bacterium]